MIRRRTHVSTIKKLLRDFPVVGLLGARQTGKTTLARELARSIKSRAEYFDLEDPRVQARFHSPMLVLEPLRGLVVLDEVQHRPELFPVLRVLADRRPRPASFLVLGSASPELLRQSSESLAGRIAYHHLGGLCLSEVGEANLGKLWVRGGLPRAFLARGEGLSMRWRLEYIRTWLERDVAAFGIGLPAATLRRFWAMLAHYHAQTWNSSELARSFGVSDKTVRGYLDILVETCMVDLLQPWFENVGKRQVRAPKVYFSDSGILHAILAIPSRDALEIHPKLGASWEGFAVAQVRSCLGVRPEECFHWSIHGGAALDLLVVRGTTRLGFEIKRTDSPIAGVAMRNMVDTLGLQRLDIIHAGRACFPMDKRIRAVPLSKIRQELERL